MAAELPSLEHKSTNPVETPEDSRTATAASDRDPVVEQATQQQQRQEDGGGGGGGGGGGDGDDEDNNDGEKEQEEQEKQQRQEELNAVTNEPMFQFFFLTATAHKMNNPLLAVRVHIIGQARKNM